VIAGPERSLVWWGWVGDHLDDIWQRTVEHVQLTVIAVVVGCALSFSLAILAVNARWTYRPITRVASILYTIPSVALFVFLIPFTGLGLLTAEIALVSYTILILVGNTVAGLDAVPAEVKEAADAMGYTRWRRLVAVEVPIAAPTIIAGIRIATVTVIGLVTLATLVGNGGYGALINDGLKRNFPTPIVVGATLSFALALVADGGLALLQWAVTPWRRAAPPAPAAPTTSVTPATSDATTDTVANTVRGSVPDTVPGPVRPP
jgi:osmoprotectant transport system permease protein